MVSLQQWLILSAFIWTAGFPPRTRLFAQGVVPTTDSETEPSAVVTFSTEPPGSSVVLNGKQIKGRTPITLRLPSGSATVTFRPQREGYKSGSATYSWDAGESKRIDFKLPRTFGYVRIVTAQQWSRLELDKHALVAKSDSWERIQAGRHVILAFNGRYLGTAKFRLPDEGRVIVSLEWRKITPDPANFTLIQTRRTKVGSADYANLNPSRFVDVKAFWIQKNEIRVREYRECVRAKGCSLPGSGENCNWNISSREEHPMNCLSALQAAEYAQWFSTLDEFTYRLPTNVEWESVATQGGTQQYPWGMETALGRCNVCDRSCSWGWHDSSVDDHWPVSAPSGFFRICVGPDQVFDLIGNVAEWSTTADRVRYDLRGGSWASPRPLYDPKSPNLKPPEFRDATTGFRLAASAFDLSSVEKE